jgi:hypothetical protein
LVFVVHPWVMERHQSRALPTYVGQVERDCDGVLWAVLYAARAGRGGSLLSREIVRTTRQGRRRVSDLVLAEADAAANLAAPARMH